MSEPVAHPVPTRNMAPTRLEIRVGGAVQGVGFRPWCMQQALTLGLSGWVRNDARGLHLEVQGPGDAVQALTDRLRDTPPPLARIDHLTVTEQPAHADDLPFAILPSQEAAAGALSTGLPPDTAPCDACLHELFDPADRRFRHPFINCTHCGPRFTITQSLPYDRPQTTLANFPLCTACASEYTDPLNRRHHAQPVACPQCGPRVALWAPDGTPLPEPDPLRAAARRLRAGEVLAIKGVGGYHLVCNAQDASALQRLRRAKRRARKPFALLAPNVASARLWVDVDEAGAALLHSPARPVLLLPCRTGVAQAHPLVAPELGDWGVMLPATPLHWVLVHELLGRPAGHDWLTEAHPLLLVMTSANPSGEPLVIDETEAVQRLVGLADALLVHDRPIVGRVDDSVRRPMPDPTGMPGALHAPFVRRARGHVPDPIELPGVPTDAPSVLATGAHLKNTVCLTRGNQAFLSPHLGDLGSAASRTALIEAVERLRRFLGVRPVVIAHDLHPDFFSTTHAAHLASEWGVPLQSVQHHHAHAAAVLAEHGLTADAPALALILDGVGLGSDGSPWGGELLRLRGPACTRLGHLPKLALPGGDRAAAEPWRLGAAVLHALGRGHEITARYADHPASATVTRMLDQGLNSPLTSSAGRLFDAAASLLGVVQIHQHEGDGAMALEALAARHGGPVQPWVQAWQIGPDGHLTWPGLWSALTAVSPDARCEAAARFHATLSAAIVDWVKHHAEAENLNTVALSGGCFINRLLRQGVVGGLHAAGLQVLEARQAPPGDGGISLGQAAVALHALQTTTP